jgi:hypothetical protein
MTDAMLEARVEVLLLVAKFPEVALLHTFDPAEPPLTEPHEKRPALDDAPTARNGPGIGLVTVNVFVEVVAVTPTGYVVWQLVLLMAAAMLEARVVVLLLVAKVPEVELVHAFDPAEPPLTAPHVKYPVAPPPIARNGPGMGLVTVNVLPEV